MSVLVIGVPTRKRARRTLNMCDVDPNGATYSARMYSRASVLLITIDYVQSVIELAYGREFEELTCIIAC